MICQGRLFAFLSLVLILTACGPKGPKRWDSFPVTLYGDASIDSDPNNRADLEDAMNFWEAKAGTKLFNYVGVWHGGAPYEGSPDHPSGINANIIFFLNPWSFPSNVAGHTIVMTEDESIEGSMVMINPNIQFCAGDCSTMDDQFRTSQRKVFAHELGHFLGLNHVEDPNNIMYPGALPGSDISGLQVEDAKLHDLTEN